MAPHVSLGFLGDIMLARDVERHFLRTPEDFTMPEIAKLLSKCHHVHANLETPVSQVGSPHPLQDPNVCFCADPSTLSVLKTLKVSSVTLANNHVLDYGPEAAMSTIAHLDELGISHLGSGKDSGAANQPLIVPVNGQRIAILASVFIYSASTKKANRRSVGAADCRLSRLLRTIRQVRDSVDHVIVSIHWGLEYSFYPLPYIQRAARRLIDEGADLVLGHGPHYIQPHEHYRDRLIVYSLGNFVFDEPFRYANLGYILITRLTPGTRPDVEIHPVELRQHVPELLTDYRAGRIRSFVGNGNRILQKKSPEFWSLQSDRYFSDMLGRSIRTRSLKYLLANPVGFYADVGLRNYARKFARLFMHPA